MEVVLLTEAAQSKVLQHLLKNQDDDSKTALRISVIGGGCSGLKHKLGLDSPKDGDIIHEYENGVKIVVDEKSALYLAGSSLEYLEDFDRSGFKVTIPNAQNTCGCGKSFS